MWFTLGFPEAPSKWMMGRREPRQRNAFQVEADPRRAAPPPPHGHDEFSRVAGAPSVERREVRVSVLYTAGSGSMEHEAWNMKLRD